MCWCTVGSVHEQWIVSDVRERPPLVAFFGWGKKEMDILQEIKFIAKFPLHFCGIADIMTPDELDFYCLIKARRCKKWLQDVKFPAKA